MAKDCDSEVQDSQRLEDPLELNKTDGLVWILFVRNDHNDSW